MEEGIANGLLFILAMAALLSLAIVGRWAVSGSQADPQERQESYWGLAKVPGLTALEPVMGSLVVAVQLVLLEVMQLPVGRLVSRCPTSAGLRLSLLAFAGGQALMTCPAFPGRRVCCWWWPPRCSRPWESRFPGHRQHSLPGTAPLLCKAGAMGAYPSVEPSAQW